MTDGSMFVNEELKRGHFLLQTGVKQLYVSFNQQIVITTDGPKVKIVKVSEGAKSHWTPEDLQGWNSESGSVLVEQIQQFFFCEAVEYINWFKDSKRYVIYGTS